MRHALLLAAVVAAAVLAAPAALAGNGNGQGGRPLDTPAPLPPALVDGPTRIDPPAAVSEVGPAAKLGSTTADCGACINTCWGATARGGVGDWSGHVYIYQYLRWCGNGAIVTWASASQSYEQAGWYKLDGSGGPWWSGGCIGCSNLRATGYVLWEWIPPLISFHQTGTSYLNSTMWAWGGVTF
jgi:hypothetical protein